MERLDRRSTWLLVGVSLLLLGVLGGWLVPWSWTPAGFGTGGGLTVPPPGRFFTPGQIARAEDYAHGARMLGLAAQAAVLVVVLVLGLTPLGSRLTGRVTRRLRWWLAVPVVALAVLLAGRLATLPFALAMRRRDLEVGLTDQGLSGWWRDRLLSLLVSWVVLSLVLLVVIALARRSRRHWPWWAGLGVVVLSFVGSFGYPLVVEPVFNRFTPVADGPFKQSVLRLAEREGVEVHDVLVADASRRTTTLNAYVSGLGNSRRVVVYDNLVHGVPRDEVLSVVAHELGHAREHDVLLGTGLGALAGLAGVGLLALVLDADRVRRHARIDGAHDVRAVPLMLALFAVATLVTLPVQNTVSRAIEARADRDALTATRDPGAFRAVQKRLALRSLADPTPPEWYHAWFGTHPTVLQRMGLADLAAGGHE